MQDGGTVAPPGVGIAAPLRMQCAHSSEAAPQGHAGADEALAKTVEQGSGLGTAQTLPDRPDMQFDDVPPEPAVETIGERRHSR